LVIQPNILDQLSGDADKLGQIIKNLINNAIKFTDDKNRHIEIIVMLNNDDKDTVRLTFDIQDNGIGIEQKNFDLVFQEYGRVNHAHEGTGLGLPICKEYVRLMDPEKGEINVKSEFGKGSNFYFTLNFKKCKKSLFAKKVEELKLAFVKETKVLLVDDAIVNRMIFLKVLKDAGITADSAVDGVDAVTKAEAKEYDIIFMDINMPNMDGFEATKQIRQHEVKNELPKSIIVALTAVSPGDVGYETKAIESGMLELWTKPIDHSVFIINLAKLLPDKTIYN